MRRINPFAALNFSQFQIQDFLKVLTVLIGRAYATRKQHRESVFQLQPFQRRITKKSLFMGRVTAKAISEL